MSFIAIILGGLLTYFSFWLLLHISDARVQRPFRSWLSERLSKDKVDVETYHTYSAAMAAAVLMLFGLGLLIGGIINLFV